MNNNNWAKKTENLSNIEEVYESNILDESGAYEGIIKVARLMRSKDENSESISLYLEILTDNNKFVRDYFLLAGRDGEDFYIDRRTQTKRKHYGRLKINGLVKILFNKEDVTDLEIEKAKFETYDYETKENKEIEANIIPTLIDKKIGICVQMQREITGDEVREMPKVLHFFNLDNGLMAYEQQPNRQVGEKSKLDNFLKMIVKNPIKEVIKEVYNIPKANFGSLKNNNTNDSNIEKLNKWGC